MESIWMAYIIGMGVQRVEPNCNIDPNKSS